MKVLTDLDFALDAGEFVVVTGPSGSGKSRTAGNEAVNANAGRGASARQACRTQDFATIHRHDLRA